MLFPRTTLIVWTAGLILPAAAIGGVAPQTLPVVVVFIAAFVLVAIGDALFARRALAGLGVELPASVRLQKDRPGTIEVKLTNTAKDARLVRVGFAFPPEIATAEHDRLIQFPAGASASRFDWSCRPGVRGQYFLDRVYLEGRSLLGLWAIRGSRPLRSELRVYPNLFDERKSVAALFLKRGLFGTHVQRQAGQGREFEKLREYLHGDSLDDIHWKASAKRGHPVTKVFQVERTHELYVIIDASRLTGRSVTLNRGEPGERVSTTVLERFVAAALILGLAAEQQGDQFGLITFSDKVLSFLRAKNGQAHYDVCRDRLYTLQPSSVSPDFGEVFSFVRLKLRKRAFIVFLTALDDPVLAEGFANGVELICRQHLVFVDILQPATAKAIFGGGDVSRLDDLYERLGGHLQWSQLRELQKGLRRHGVRLSLLDPTMLPAQLVAQHGEVRTRQLV